MFASWDKPYLTMDYSYEATIVREFAKFIEQGMVYKGLKPVHWCMQCQTALAEAEVEYDNHRSPSIYVKFPVKSGWKRSDQRTRSGQNAFCHLDHHSLDFARQPGDLPASGF